VFNVYFVLEFKENRKYDKMFFHPTYPNLFAFEARNRTISFSGVGGGIITAATGNRNNRTLVVLFGSVPLF
jgi:hypothetical protein